KRHLGYICRRRELAVHGFPQHHVLDHFLLGDAELVRLLRDLLVDERRADVPRTDHVGADAVLAALLGDRLAQPDQPVLGRYIGFLQFRSFLRMYRPHIDYAPTSAGSQHVAHTGPRGEEGAVEMDGQHLLPVREGKTFNRMYDLDTGVADEDI